MKLINSPTNPYIFQFLPIIILFLYLTYRDVFVQQSQTILGRVFAIGIIFYYTTIKRLYGLLTVIAVILFYQFETEDKLLKEGFDTELMKVENENIRPPILTPSSGEFAEYTDAYSPDYVPEIQIDMMNHKYDKIKEQFRKEYCDAGYLKYKNHVVKPEMAELIFPDLKFENEYKKCNPCDPQCSFTISHLNSEFDLIEPKSSNDWVAQNSPFMKVVFETPTNFVPV